MKITASIHRRWSLLWLDEAGVLTIQVGRVLIEVAH
jgi:hypothetical protein